MTSFTGRKRQRRTRWQVRAADLLAHGLIVAGGIGTILAVSLVCIFLVWVVLPLVAPGLVDAAARRPLAELGTSSAPWKNPPWRLAVNEHRSMGWALDRDGQLNLFRLDGEHRGQSLGRRRLWDENAPPLTAASFAAADDRVALGFADGAVRLGEIAFQTSVVPQREQTRYLGQLQAGQLADDGETLVERTQRNQLRRQAVSIKLEPPLAERLSAAVELLDISWRHRKAVAAAYTADGTLRLMVLKILRDPETDERTYKTRSVELPRSSKAPNEKPFGLFVSGVGDNVFVLWKDGWLVRYDVRNVQQARIAEEVDLTPELGVSLTALDMLIGKTTLVAGDSMGRVRAWFRVNRPATDQGASEAERTTTLVAAHDLPGPTAVTALAPSPRSRMLAVAYADGSVRLFYVTNDALLAETIGGASQAFAVLAMHPRDDGLLGAAPDSLSLWAVNIPHPEVSLRSLFLPIWYEGYESPSLEWQSSGGTDNFEPKLGLTKLIFGTLKATFYSLLIGVPLALLAAVYTSEFLHKRVRARIKPTIELMAGLPSVVLGFIAALVLAPIVEGILPTVLMALVTVPLALLFSAFVWQIIPKSLRTRLAAWRFAGMCLALPLGLWWAHALGRPVERLLFAGDLIGWLSGRGTAPGGWMLLFIPIAALGAAWLLAVYVNPSLRARSRAWSEARLAAAELIKFVVAAAVALLAAWLMSLTMSAAGFDPRGTFVGPYEQLNALVVGFVMGFAIIPIIYTIAEDALSTVPQHLRSASLGAGATAWQTATRIVIPTAMSGLFSAVMVGLGRAVGETMIVLMAAGNTPVLDWNVFNGFRTLSGNIAEEMPEAVKDSTHYRTLFLAALVLFALTFVLNTVAENVRQRFRKRAFQL
ncbi:MAG TPA: ABC transporter permease subunit [Pirellulales bacterium]|nr:ABC transporter permease subunit [Pirellulales bacterium]